MANVVDPNSWRMIPPSDPQRPVQSTPPSAADSHSAPDPAPPEVRQANACSAIAQLSTALGRTFDSQRDQVVWNLASSVSRQRPGGEGYLRVDIQHKPPAPILANPAADGFDVNHAETRSWLVIVENARELGAADNSRRLEQARAGDAQLLVVACDVEEAATAVAGPLDDTPGNASGHASAEAARLQFDYVGPIPADDAGQLAEALLRIKRLDRPTLLHLAARVQIAPPPHFVPDAPSEPDTSAPEALSLRAIAALALAEVARRDERIVAVTSDADPALIAAWQSLGERLFSVAAGVPHALAWSASLASGTSRPFVFLTSDESQDGLGQIRRDICLPRAAVTLIVEARALEGASSKPGSACLAAFRQLPNLALLSPKDPLELRQMLAWCADQADPALIWLTEQFEPQEAPRPGSPIALARGEQVREGHDVVVVAWGAVTAAAAIAADSLTLWGIDATVINARFGHPLDVDMIVRAARESTYVVLVDDAPQSGGFAGWVLEELLRAGVAQSTTIVAPPPGHDRQDRHDPYNRLADIIVERCRWLAEPAAVPIEVLDGPNVPIVVQDRAASADWFTPPSLAVADARDLPRQILTQQFSPFIEHWVGEYAKVGLRDVYLWQWCLHGLGLTTLSCVAPRLRQDLCETKLLAVMYGVMLDDVADQGGADDFLNELTKIIAGDPDRDFSRFASGQQRYARFTVDLWDTFESRLKASPYFGEYEELLVYDHRQILNTFAYSWMVNQHPALLNVQEHDMYMPHNMQMMSFATMDLMCSADFDRNELGKLREAIWHAQSMGRIGNLVSTWQREIADRDFTSGVFARALRQGDLTPDDLKNARPEAIERAIREGGHELYFLQKWEAHRQCIEALASHIRSVDVGQLLVALKRLIHMELSSRGFK
jgi:transketolase C-terminal domain/subunit